MAKPTVFVSSTCYDLRQIRTDLSQFIEKELGYQAFLSEQSSFPIDPDMSAIDNCRRRVEQDADILVLIIGGRYGFVDSDTAKSITNLEYLTARAKGIPIYAFLDKQVLAVMSVWERNKEADFSRQVDNPALFEFINRARTTDKIWTNGFESAQDIIESLRAQFAHMMTEGLQWRLQLRSSGNQQGLKRLSGRAFRLALEQPRGWEYRLFSQVLDDEIGAIGDLRREHKADISLGVSEHVAPDSFGTWVQVRMDELERWVNAVNTLVTSTLMDALGPPGHAGNAEDIAFAARQIALIYRHEIEWAQRVRRTHVETEFAQVVAAMAGFTESMIAEIEQFGPALVAKVDQALMDSDNGTVQPVEVTLRIDISNMDTYKSAFNDLMANLGLDTVFHP